MEMRANWEQVRDEMAQHLFLLAGYCAPQQPIPWPLLVQALQLLPPDSLLEKLFGGGKEPSLEGLDKALKVLTRLQLIEIQEPEVGPTIQPALAEYARSQASGAVLVTLVEALLLLTGKAIDAQSPALFEPLHPHVEVVAAAAQKAGLEKAGMLWNDLGLYLNLIADHNGAWAALKQALAAWRSLYGEEHVQVASAHNNLGGVLQTLGDLEGARAAYEQALAVKEAVYEPYHPSIATTANNLGLVLQGLGDLEGARAVLERALAIDERACGPDHPDVATDAHHLGGVLQELGDLKGARAALERAYRIRESCLPPGHPKTESVRQRLEELRGRTV